MKHKHHIIPKHMGGSDDPDNIIELTIEEHAEAHRILYEQHGKVEDYWAWKGLSGQIGKEELLSFLSSHFGKKGGEKAKSLSKGIHTQDKDLKRYWSSLQPLEYKIIGGKNSGKKNAESGHCAKIAHLGGKSSAGMKFWYNATTNEETRSFESPGNEWSQGVKMDRVNIDSLKHNSSNRKNSFWIFNPKTNQTKMIFENEIIPDGFIKGRKVEIKNTIELLNTDKDINSLYKEIKFDRYYNKWLFEYRIEGKKNKITHTDYYGLIWVRDLMIDSMNLQLEKSNFNFSSRFSKEEIVDTLKSFNEYLKIQKILQKKMKKSKRDIYLKKLESYESKYKLLDDIRNNIIYSSF